MESRIHGVGPIPRMGLYNALVTKNFGQEWKEKVLYDRDGFRSDSLHNVDVV